MRFTEEEYNEWLNKPCDRILAEKKRERVNNQEEFKIQSQVVNWIRLQYPNILWTASSQGLKVSKYVAKKMKALGYQKGTADIIIFEPRMKSNQDPLYVKMIHGLFLEMKAPVGKQSPDQIIWQRKAEERGYIYKLAYSFDEAEKIIDKYLRGEG